MVFREMVIDPTDLVPVALPLIDWLAQEEAPIRRPRRWSPAPETPAPVLQPFVELLPLPPGPE